MKPTDRKMLSLTRLSDKTIGIFCDLQLFGVITFAERPDERIFGDLAEQLNLQNRGIFGIISVKELENETNETSRRPRRAHDSFK